MKGQVQRVIGQKWEMGGCIQDQVSVQRAKEGGGCWVHCNGEVSGEGDGKVRPIGKGTWLEVAGAISTEKWNTL